jgi:AcrR family transcriptional regulator
MIEPKKKTTQRKLTPATKPLSAVRRAGAGAGTRDRAETRKKILAAMGRLLERKGSTALGINAIAREARVDKVLIYRYFGGISELYHAFALEGNSFPSFDEIAGGHLPELLRLPPPEMAKAMILGFGRVLRRRPITKEMYRWELQERNELTEALAKERERVSMEWLALAPDMHGEDLAAVVSILVAGQIYLTLRSKTSDTYNGLDLTSESGWKRIENAVALLSDLFFQHVASIPGKTGRKHAGKRGEELPL